MQCEICGARSAHDFSKTFDAFGLSKVDYWRCSACGFVLSRTHAEMSSASWAYLNEACHKSYQGQPVNALDPRWKTRLSAQANTLSDLAQADLLSGRWLDFGCGDGALSAVLAEKSGRDLLKYDAYMAADESYLKDEDLKPCAFGFVITTSVFEHFTRRAQWDAVDALVAPDGALGVHTLVAERVPSDPDWFYLQPPHCAFFSNAAMEHLFRAWGYRASVYDVAASLWVWFRDDPAVIARKVERANGVRSVPLSFKEGFVDYWKSDPRRRDE